ncbi:(2Fe-2S)-binding protein [Pseudoruegeria sp. SK021]|uniref:(2Fe-2S)-binding protein n=1 Tax=Pseudoruegeria sp. SK021 TaxID=1933035 RepID=UPI000A21E252|nr:(2Fe-2S)-binding protein [Pseudoruegeria sp. SK021]OSP53999.1 hypothetical protein BV911_14805 [Pseudoruegeria sp. SK021]
MHRKMAARELSIQVDGKTIGCEPGQSVASALLAQGIYRFRTSPNDHLPRGPFCMMGACQECAILIDGSIRRACQTEVAEGMRVCLKGASA